MASIRNSQLLRFRANKCEHTVISNEPENSRGPKVKVEKRVALDLKRWVGNAVDDGLTCNEALTQLRGRLVPWRAQSSKA
jgi:hypothetical protein